VLDSVPDLDLLTYLPQLLDGLMNLLSDPNREIRVAAHKCMMEFLVEIQVRVYTTGSDRTAVLLMSISTAQRRSAGGQQQTCGQQEG
jgi:vacuole morphology and inheritance protein 14